MDVSNLRLLRVDDDPSYRKQCQGLADFLTALEGMKANLKKAITEKELEKADGLELLIESRKRAAKIMQERLKESRAKIQNGIDNDIQKAYRIKLTAATDSAVNFLKLDEELRDFSRQIKNSTSFAAPVEQVSFPGFDWEHVRKWLDDHGITDVPEMPDTTKCDFQPNRTALKEVML